MESKKASSKLSKTKNLELPIKRKAKSPAKSQTKKQKLKQKTELLNYGDLPINHHLKESISKVGLSDFSTTHSQLLSIAINRGNILCFLDNLPQRSTHIMVLATTLLDLLVVDKSKGIGVIVLTNSREKAAQYDEIAEELLEGLDFSHGIVVDGNNKKAESQKLTKIKGVLTATPERLLYHLITNAHFFEHSKLLILDDVSSGSDLEQTLKNIKSSLKAEIQTIIFSTQQCSDDGLPIIIQNLTRIGFGQENKDEVNPEISVEQGYVIVEPEHRLNLLYSFLKKHQDKKIMVFFNSSNSVKFHHDLLAHYELTSAELHGKLKSTQRESIYKDFSEAESGILLSTDVAVQGLRIPDVDWIIQYEQPESIKDYVRKIENASRINRPSKGLIFLQDHEMTFIQHLKNDFQFEYTKNKLVNIQAQTERLIEKAYDLHRLARDAYRAYILGYNSNPLKEIFNLNSLDISKAAKSFGFVNPPLVNLHKSKDD